MRGQSKNDITQRERVNRSAALLIADANGRCRRLWLKCNGFALAA